MLIGAFILVVVAASTLTLRPNNYDSIRHANFDAFWRLDFSHGQGALLHTSLKTIAYSIIENGELQKNMRNLVEDCHSVIALDYLLRDKLLVWADAGGTSENDEPIAGSVNVYHAQNATWRFDLPPRSDVASIAVDWVSQMIYWSDGTEDQINVCTLRGQYCKPIVHERLKIKRMSFLQIDSLNARLYFDNQDTSPRTNQSPPRRIIESVSLDGTDRKMLIGPQTDNHRTQEFRLHDIHGMLVTVDSIFLSCNNTIYRISLEHPGETRVVYPGDNIGMISYSSGRLYWLEEPQHLTKINSIHYPYRGDEPATTKLTGNEVYLMRAIAEPNQPLTNSEHYQPRCDAKNCSHLCLRKSSYPNVACACPAGIQFKGSDADKSDSECNAIPQKLMVIPQNRYSANELRVISLDTDYLHSRVVYSKERVSAVAIDPIHQLIYFGTMPDDSSHQLPFIGRIRLDGSGFERIITTGVEAIEGLALDHENQLLYWTDPKLNHIEMAALDCRCDVASCLEENGVCRKIIVVFDNDKVDDHPRGIAVGHGKIYWSDWGNHPRIDGAEQDGQGQRSLVEQNIKWPNDLTLSSDGQYLFYLDNHKETKTINQVDTVTGQRTEIYKLSRNDYYAIDYFMGNIFFAGRDNAIKVIRRGPDYQWLADNSPYSSWFRHKNLKTQRIKTVDFGQDYQLNKARANCPYIYVPQGTQGYQCACPDDMVPLVSRCGAKPIHMLIATTSAKRKDRHQLVEIDLTDPKEKLVLDHIEGDANGQINLDYHYDHNFIFYFSIKNGKNTLMRMKVHDKDKTDVQPITNIGLKKATALAIDWLGDSVYWINEQSNKYFRIEQIGMNGQSRRTVIWGNELDEPYELKVDPIQGYIFWTDWRKRLEDKTDQIRIIARATMAGDDITPLATNRFNTVGDRIKHMTLDYRSQTIYYVDYDKDNIQSISYHQKLTDKPKVIKSVGGAGGGVPRIPAFYDRTLYWTSHLESSKASQWSIEGTNFTANVATGSISLDNIDDIGDMALKAPQLGWSRCLGFDACSGLCVTKPGGDDDETAHFECVCQSHYTPMDKGASPRGCQPPRQFMLFSQRGSISRMNFDEASREYGHDQILSISDIIEPVALSWDEKNRRIYWLEVDNSIWSSDESGHNKTQLNRGIEISARDFDIYHASSLIYWTNQLNDTIHLARLTADGIGVMLGGIGLDQDDIVPDQIAIGSQTGQIVFTNMCRDAGQTCELIYKSNMDGSELCTILQGTPHVTSLALFEDARSNEATVYWNDAGKMRRKFLTSGAGCGANQKFEIIKESPARSIVVTRPKRSNEQKFYWIESSAKDTEDTLMSLYSSQTHQSSSLLLKLEQLRALYVVSGEIDIDACDHIECSHICQVRRDAEPVCRCPAGSQLIDDYKCLPMSNCEQNEFSCDGKCLPDIIRCDGSQDCDDGSDERDCPLCQEIRQFKCLKTAKCIPAHKRCDGVDDCGDGSDEYCPVGVNYCHDQGMMECHDKLMCYSKQDRCDGTPNCDDGSDEINCSNSVPTIKTQRVIIMSILAAALIVFCVLLAFCYFNRRDSHAPAQQQPPLVSPVHIRLDIRPTLYSEATTSCAAEPMLPHPPAPPPTITGGNEGGGRSNRSTTTTTSYTPRYHHRRELLREQPSGCSEPPSYDNLISSGSSSNGYDYRPRQRHCPTPVQSDKE